jgi:hypothetical protein
MIRKFVKCFFAFFCLSTLAIGCFNGQGKEVQTENYVRSGCDERPDERLQDECYQKTVKILDSHLDTSLYKERIRLLMALDCGDNNLCDYHFSENKLDKGLLKKLNLCKINDTNDVYAYYLLLEECDYVCSDEMRVFTLDKAQKDSSVLLVAICEGDQDPRNSSQGLCLVFMRQEGNYNLTDIVFGKLTAFDVDKNDRLHPIFWGYGERFYPEKKSDEPYSLEVQMGWDGKHLKSNEIVGVDFSDSNTLSTKDMKSQGIYNRLSKKYIGLGADMVKGRKIHWIFRSYARHLKYNEPDGLGVVDSSWVEGYLE